MNLRIDQVTFQIDVGRGEPIDWTVSWNTAVALAERALEKSVTAGLADELKAKGTSAPIRVDLVTAMELDELLSRWLATGLAPDDVRGLRDVVLMALSPARR